jgi:predicted ATPase
MIFEDVHWIDPTTLEVLGRTVDRLRTLGVRPPIARRTVSLQGSRDTQGHSDR